MHWLVVALLLVCVLVGGCTVPSVADPDAPAPADAPRADGGEDAARIDAPVADAAPHDGGDPDAPLPHPTSLCAHEAPRVLWIEPDALSAGVLPRSRPPTATDVRALVRRAYARGFETLVVAYVQRANCFNYHSEITLAFPDLSAPPATYVPAERYCSYLPSEGFLETLLDEAGRLGLSVVIGLGQAGDPLLLYDIEQYYQLAPPLPDITPLNDRLSAVRERNQAVADELIARFGDMPAFGGFYFSHEPHCLDIAQNLWQPLSDRIEATRPGTFLLASPPTALSVCLGGASVAERLDALRLGAVAYQDAVGAGTRPADGVYTCDDAVRDARIAGLPAAYAAIAASHSGARTAVWANVEAWQMDGTDREGMRLPPSAASLCFYGYPRAAPFERVERQIAAAADVAAEVMLNEASLVFQGDGGFELTHPFERVPAEAFTRAYDACLR